ncbi:MAG: general secretion pathway protein GspB [Acidobacteria bacterium]|nr:general secretion pathway protein GspB [Acidobacteriota bacterium]MDW7984966.1 hypothetical protein [Acidobacteriota bacterium]
MSPDGTSKSARSLWAVGGLVIAYIGLLNLLGSQRPALRPPRPIPVPRPENVPGMTCTDVGGSNAEALIPPRRDIFHWEENTSAGRLPLGKSLSDTARPPVASIPEVVRPKAWVLLGVLQAVGPPVSVWHSGTDILTLKEGDRLGDGVRVQAIRPDGVVLAFPKGMSRYVPVGSAFYPSGQVSHR